MPQFKFNEKIKITILDLGYGNFKSLLNAFDYLNIKK